MEKNYILSSAYFNLEIHEPKNTRGHRMKLESKGYPVEGRAQKWIKTELWMKSFWELDLAMTDTINYPSCQFLNLLLVKRKATGTVSSDNLH